MNFFIKNILFSLFLSFALSAVISYGGDCAEIESIVRERVSDVDSCIKECIVNNAGEVTTLWVYKYFFIITLFKFKHKILILFIVVNIF